jgi:hypothetical protein
MSNTTSTSQQESLLNKIRNLLKLADPANGATQAEMETAMRKAQELMVRHGIEQMDLGSAAEASPVDEERVTMSRKKYPQDRWIPRVLKAVFDVDILVSSAWRHGAYRHMYIIIGEPVDREAAKMAITYVFDAMTKGLNAYLKVTGQSWNSTTAHSFYRGVAEGFIRESAHGRAAAMKRFKKEEQDRFAIVLVDKSKAIAKYVETKYPKLRYGSRGIRANFDESAHAAGHAAGAAIDFSTKLN